jgi:hypothetical protein
MGPGEYLEHGLFGVDPRGFIVYNVPLKIMGPGNYLKCQLKKNCWSDNL